jgi:predicted DNA-binding WGR domain protein
MANKNEFVTLYFKDAKSDKVYQASLEEVHGGYGFVVNFAFGRRSGNLKEGTKTPDPVHYDEAKEIYDELVFSKRSKGYKPGPFYSMGLKDPR